MFPLAEVTCLDLADNMIAMAKAKLGFCPRVRYIAGDFNILDSSSKYDAIVSSLALHHLVTDEDKRRFYRRSYQTLNPGGVLQRRCGPGFHRLPANRVCAAMAGLHAS